MKDSKILIIGAHTFSKYNVFSGASCKDKMKTVKL